MVNFKDVNKSKFNLQAEKNVLSSLFSNKENFFLCIEKNLRPRHFYNKKNKKVYSKMLEVFEEESKVSHSLVYDKLKDDENIGADYLFDIQSFSIQANLELEDNIAIIKQRYQQRQLLRFWDKVKAQVQNNTDPDKIINSSLWELQDIVEDRESSKSDDIEDIAVDRYGDYEKIWSGEKVESIVPTGFSQLDDILSWWLKGSQLFIIAARPSMGKTSLWLSMAVKMAENFKDKKILFESLEMWKKELFDKVVSLYSQVNSNRLLNNKATDKEKEAVIEAVGKVSKLNMLLDAGGTGFANSIERIYSKCKMTKNLWLLIVDYIQLIDSERKFNNSPARVSYVSRKLKQIGKEFDIPVIAISQLNRKVEGLNDKRPKLSHLRGSGSLEQDADIVSFVYREDYYDDDFITNQWEWELTTSIAELIIRKQRNWQIGTVPFLFKHEIAKFEEPSEEQVEEYENMLGGW